MALFRFSRYGQGKSSPDILFGVDQSIYRTDEFRPTEEDMALLPRDVRRAPDNHFQQLKERVLRLRTIHKILHKHMENIQRLYNRGLDMYEANAHFFYENIRFKSTAVYRTFAALLNQLSAEKEELEEIRNKMRRIVSHAETESDLTEFVESGPMIETSYNILNIKFRVIEANLRLSALHYSTLSLLKSGEHYQPFRRDPPLVKTDAFKTPKELQQWWYTVLNLEESLILMWSYRRHLYSDDSLELFTRLRDCEEFEGKQSLVDELFNAMQEFEIPIEEYISRGPAWNKAFTRINNYRNSNIQRSWFIGMRELLKVIETSCRRTEFRYRVYEVDNIRKKHFIVQIRGYVPKSVFFPNLELKNITEVKFQDISQHYFNYRSRGATESWRVCDEEGDLIPEEAAAADAEIAAFEEQERQEWETGLRQLTPTERANLVYRKTGHFKLP